MRSFTRLSALIVLLTIGAGAARAQSAAPVPAAAEPTAGWSASAGYETFAFRDISRNGRPPDASPVSWRGDGPVVMGRYENARRKSSHLADVAFAQFGRFEYVSPTSAVAAPSSDTGSRFEAKYEYRRYFWRDLGLRGFDLGFGIQGIGTRLALDRYISSATHTSSRMTGGGFAGVVAVNFDRWQRLHLQAAWANGEVASHRDTEHSADPLALVSTGGGHWLSDLTADVAWHLTPVLQFTGAWRLSAAGYASSHMSFSERRQSLTAGLVYVR